MADVDCPDVLHREIDGVRNETTPVRLVVETERLALLPGSGDGHPRAEDDLSEVSSTTLPFHHGAVSVVKILQHHDACVGAEVEVPEHMARRE